MEDSSVNHATPSPFVRMHLPDDLVAIVTAFQRRRRQYTMW
jgi:hypothetical protein